MSDIFFSFFGEKKVPVKLVTPPGQEENIHIPVSEIQGTAPGKRLLITAGVDGDEYAGIAAAYAIIEKYSHTNFQGNLTILPIVNMPGFLGEQSKNPIDSKFPKFELPGRLHGTSSERLMHFVVSQYAARADVWLDLHGGALTERVWPHVWVYHTGVAAVDLLAKKFCEASNSNVLYIQSLQRTFSKIFAKQDGTYILLESGGRGEQLEQDVSRHVYWVETMMHMLGMINQQPQAHESGKSKLLGAYKLVFAPCDGIYTPVLLGDEVVRGEPLGSYRTFTGNNNPLVAPCAGTPLWQKETMAMRKGDVLCAIAH